MNKNNEKNNEISRSPVVVVMGHVDHGKSTLLDYIRKTNIVSCEAGGITQCINAYEVNHKTENGETKTITFLDTPGHEAFSKMRERGASAADIAILVVSAEDSVKAQTIEAYNTIIESKTPYIVAINKIDRPNANIEKTKMDLAEKGIYLEGMGGDISYVLISAKEGTGINELLDMIILVSDMENFTGTKEKNASGVIIESKRDPQRGVSASCIIKNGTLKQGMFVASGESIVSVKMMESFLGKPIKEATFSSPIRLTGFDNIPEVGSEFNSFDSKKEAENYIKEIKEINNNLNSKNKKEELDAQKTIPIIIKTDVSGSVEAIEKEISKINNEELSYKIILSGVGAINENDLKMASINKDSLVLGFNVKIENGARDLNESLKVKTEIFNIIYKLTDFLKETAEEKRPRQETTEVLGGLKVLKTFGETKGKQVIGGKVINGKISQNSNVRIIRRDHEIGIGKIAEIQTNKIKVKDVEENCECGILIDSKIEIAGGDVLEAFIITFK